jgi:hypothetical protein
MVLLSAGMLQIETSVSHSSVPMAQLVEVLKYKQEGRGFDSDLGCDPAWFVGYV